MSWRLLTCELNIHEGTVGDFGVAAVPYGDDSDGYYNVMTSTEQQQQQQQQQNQQHSPPAVESYRGVVSRPAPSDMSTPATTVAANVIDDEANDRELNLTLSAPMAAAPTTIMQWVTRCISSHQEAAPSHETTADSRLIVGVILVA